MSERYEPTSDFLCAILNEDVPLSDSKMAEENLRRLIEMTRDEDLSNRDWATFLLAHEETDSPAVRDALMRATTDDDGMVRAEAVLGLAMRDPLLALPFVRRALRAETVEILMLEAAALCAHPSLIEDLRAWAKPSDQPRIDALAAEALTACEKAAVAPTPDKKADLLLGARHGSDAVQ